MGNRTTDSDDPSEGALVPSGIPAATVRRLILYAREIQRLRREGEQHVRSRKLGELLGISDAVVRRDLGYVGQLGRRGVGYDLERLQGEIRSCLGTNSRWRAAIIGAGRLGNALMRYQGFADQGFELVAAFDTDPESVGKSIEGVPVLPMSELEPIFRAEDIQLAILAVPASEAAAVTQRLESAGIVGILNFAPVTLQPKKASIVNVDLASELQQVAFAVARRRVLEEGLPEPPFEAD